MELGRSLTQTSLDRLLMSLDPDREVAGRKYETLRKGVVRFFEWRGCRSAEEYADEAINMAGSGGEYTVVEGFGWTNGVLLWTVDTFGDRLATPKCGKITAATTTPEPTGKPSRARRAVELLQHP